ELVMLPRLQHPSHGGRSDKLQRGIRRRDRQSARDVEPDGCPPGVRGRTDRGGQELHHGGGVLANREYHRRSHVVEPEELPKTGNQRLADQLLTLVRDGRNTVVLEVEEGLDGHWLQPRGTS